jgi:hypothetical protein
MPRDFTRAPEPNIVPTQKRPPTFLQDLTVPTYAGYVMPEVASLIPDLSIWSKEFGAAYISMEAVTQRGSALQQYVSRTFYNHAFNYMDVAVKPTLSYWPLIGTFERILISENPFALVHLLFILDCKAQQISTHALSGVRFMRAINAVWASRDTDCLVDSTWVLAVTRNIAWKVIFIAEPTAGHAMFALPYYQENWNRAVQGTPIQGWDFN